MHYLPNDFADRFEPRFGIATKPVEPGQSFDTNNDLYLCDDGRTVLHRDGHVSYGGAADALVEYNKRHMRPANFKEYYGDEEIEEDFALLHGV